MLFRHGSAAAVPKSTRRSFAENVTGADGNLCAAVTRMNRGEALLPAVASLCPKINGNNKCRIITEKCVSREPKKKKKLRVCKPIIIRSELKNE